jgi:1,4-alpha-glucan branching enzyme
MPYIIKKVPNAHYLVVGDGYLRERMESRISELGISSNVSFLGMIENHRVFEYMCRADVIVFPSTAESSSIACAEAMGMGKLVVASCVGGLIELIGRDESRGRLVKLVPWEGSNYAAPDYLDEDRYRALAETIVSGLQESTENDIKRENALNYAQTELSWDAIFKKTILVYNKMRL